MAELGLDVVVFPVSPSHESGLGGKSGKPCSGLESLLRSETALPPCKRDCDFAPCRFDVELWSEGKKIEKNVKGLPQRAITFRLNPTYICINDIVRIWTKWMILSHRWRWTTRWILWRTWTTVQIWTTQRMWWGAFIQTQIDGAIAIITKVCN